MICGIASSASHLTVCRVFCQERSSTKATRWFQAPTTTSRRCNVKSLGSKRLSQTVKASKSLFKKTCWFRVESFPTLILHFCFLIFKTLFLRPIAISTPTAVPSPFVAVLATWRRRAFQVQQPKTCWLTKYKLQVRNKLVDFTMPISLSYYVNPTYEIGQICLQSAVFPAFSSVYEVTTVVGIIFFQIWVFVLSIPLPIGSMYAIYIYICGNMYHKYTPVMLAYIAAPWIRHGLWHISTYADHFCYPNFDPTVCPASRRPASWIMSH